MTTKGHQIKAPILFYLTLLFIICVTAPIKGEESRKLDEATNGGVKCTPCEGGNTPSQPPPTPTIEYFSPPPPSPPPPSPPPPEYVYSSPPPPSPKKPPSKNCPPPPSSSAYLYMTGPPGNLYPVNENFSGASHNHHHSFAVFLPLLVGMLGMTMAF